MAFIGKGADIDPTGAYRFRLWREWNPEAGRVLFVMLNPSTADASADDPTIRRCVGFARAWGFGALDVCNLFALRATNPQELYRHANPVGAGNDRALSSAAGAAKRVVVAWGTHGGLLGRSSEVVRMLLSKAGSLWSLGETKGGFPRHPLYVRGDTRLTVYAPLIPRGGP